MDTSSMDWSEDPPPKLLTPPKCEIYSAELFSNNRSSNKRSFAEISHATEQPLERNHYIIPQGHSAPADSIHPAQPAPWYKPVTKGLQWTVFAIYFVGAVTAVAAIQAGQLSWKGTRGLGRLAARQPPVQRAVTAVVGIANTHKRRLVSYISGPQGPSILPPQRRRSRIPGQHSPPSVQASQIFQQHGSSIKYISPSRSSKGRHLSPSQWSHDAFTNEIASQIFPPKPHPGDMPEPQAGLQDYDSSALTTSSNANRSNNRSGIQTATSLSAPSVDDRESDLTFSIKSNTAGRSLEFKSPDTPTSSARPSPIAAVVGPATRRSRPGTSESSAILRTPLSVIALNKVKTRPIAKDHAPSVGRSALKISRAALSRQDTTNLKRYFNFQKTATLTPIRKSVGFYESPMTGQPVSKVKKYVIGEPISYTENDSETSISAQPYSDTNYPAVGELSSCSEYNIENSSILQPRLEVEHPTLDEPGTFIETDSDLSPAGQLYPETKQHVIHGPCSFAREDNPTAPEQAALDAQLFRHVQESSPESTSLGCLPLQTIQHPDVATSNDVTNTAESPRTLGKLQILPSEGDIDHETQPKFVNGFWRKLSKAVVSIAIPGQTDRSEMIPSQMVVDPSDLPLHQVEHPPESESRHTGQGGSCPPLPEQSHGKSELVANLCESSSESENIFSRLFAQSGASRGAVFEPPENAKNALIQSPHQRESSSESGKDSGGVFAPLVDSQMTKPKETFGPASGSAQSNSQYGSSPESVKGSRSLFVQSGSPREMSPNVSAATFEVPAQLSGPRRSSSGSKSDPDCLSTEPDKQGASPENAHHLQPLLQRTASLGSLGLEELKLSDRRRAAREQKEAERRAYEQAIIDEKEAKARALLEVQVKQEADAKCRRDGIRRRPTEPIIQPLSEEWEQKLAEALAKPWEAIIGKTSKDVKITRRDIGTVLPQKGARDARNAWLNDEIIAAYLQAVVDCGLKQVGHRQTRTSTPKLHAFNNFFYNNLKQGGYAKVEKWAKRVHLGGKDLLKVDLVFMPINSSGTHWTLAVVSPVRKTIEYFDSMHGPSAGIVTNIKKWLKGELRDEYKDSEWKVLEDEGRTGRGKGPVQDNANDCGVFTITTAKAIVLGVDPMTVSAADMPLQRKRVVAEIMNGGFTGDFEPHVIFA